MFRLIQQRRLGWGLAQLLLTSWLWQTVALAQTAAPPPLTPALRATVIKEALQALNQVYVFPEKAQQMAAAIEARLARQEYDQSTSAEDFARLLTEHLQEISHDKHLRVLSTTGSGAGFAQRLNPAQNRAASLKRNFGFEKVERLAGNVGYLELRGFEDPDAAAATMTAAMGFLANTDALIIDLRNNGGGSPETVALLSSYFFAQPTHLNDIYDRPSNTTREFWTKASVPGPHYGNKPLYVLTSKRTFSAGEEFPYNLKNLKRATLIGETTGGGAHPVTPQRLSGGFIITLPSARSINPISKTNWEGTGVTPDIAVTADQALKAAYWLALKQLQPQATEPLFATQLQNALATAQSEMNEATRQVMLNAAPVTQQAPTTTTVTAPPVSVAPAKPASTSAANNNDKQLPKTPAGQTFGKFLTALNSGDLATMKRFHRETHGDEENAEQDLGLFQRTGGLTLHSVVRSTDYELTALLQAKQENRWLNFSISVTPEAPHAITDIRVQPTSAPAGTPAATERVGAVRSPATPGKKLSEAEALKEVETLLEQQNAADQFSGVVLIAKQGQPLWQHAYGMANRADQVPNRLDTKFNLGSINKIFTRIAITQLIEQGKLALTDTLNKHLPDYPNQTAAAKITVKQLLDMQSGIGDFFGPRFDATPKNKLRTLQDYLALFADAPLVFEPGTSRNYSNGGYIVLGVLIEKVTGQSYFDYVRTHIFQPAGMNDTDAYEEDVAVTNRATGYMKPASATNQARISNVYTKPARGSSAGGGYSTTADLLKFTQALKQGKLFTTEQNQKQFAQRVGVAGGAPGINAILEWDPQTGYVVIVLSNYDPPSAEKIGQRIREWLSMD